MTMVTMQVLKDRPQTVAKLNSSQEFILDLVVSETIDGLRVSLFVMMCAIMGSTIPRPLRVT
jgi:hypothetical protein